MQSLGGRGQLEQLSLKSVVREFTTRATTEGSGPRRPVEPSHAATPSMPISVMGSKICASGMMSSAAAFIAALRTVSHGMVSAGGDHHFHERAFLADGEGEKVHQRLD